MRLSPFCWFAIATIAVLLPSSLASANVGPPSVGGQVIAEPVGLIDIDILRETLRIDLRPLANKGPALVEATYHLRNQGQNKHLELLFASGSPDVSSFQVWLDETKITTQKASDLKIPDSWLPPQKTPGLDKSGELAYGATRAHPILFQATIPTGEHKLKVTYSAETAINRLGEPTVYHQFAYVLAPAKAWASFGGLNLRIDLPKGWRISSAPALPREGDTLEISWDRLPADAIALTLQAPEGTTYWPMVYGSFSLFLAALVVGGLKCGGVGWSSVDLSRGDLAPAAAPSFPWLSLAGWAVIWAIVVVGIGLLAVLGPDSVLPEGQVGHYGYGQLFALVGVILLGIALLPLGILAGGVGRVLGKLLRKPV